MGPLKGIRVIEMVGLGPAPFAGMMLADMGAEVIQIERKADLSKTRIPNANRRGKKSIVLDLKVSEDVNRFRKLIKTADALIEGFRPGVMEKLGLGPDTLLFDNPKLVYGRMTGWGQTGPLAKVAGHDINYISLTGALAAIGRKGEKPVPPINLVGDYGGGGVFLVVGILAALLECKSSGKGQVVDAAMTDGSAILMTIFQSLDALNRWTPERGSNWLDGGSHYYDAYKTSDGKYISIGPLEPQFYAMLIDKLNLDDALFSEQNNPELWPKQKEVLTNIFLQKTREQWCEILEGTDVCFAPVLNYREAPHHPHNQARKTYVEVDGILQAAPAPRFSRTVSEIKHGSAYAGEHTEEILRSIET